jgi:phosphopantetheine adenylyltransferase
MIQLTETTFINNIDDIMVAHVISYINSNKKEERVLVVKLKDGYTVHVTDKEIDATLKILSSLSSLVESSTTTTKVPTTIQPWLSAAQELSLGKRRW